jgi:peptide/nickel transport system permease protein
MAIISKRVLSAIPVLFIVSVMVFLMLQLLPGDPATVILGQEATPEAIAAMRETLGLNKPLIIQYLDWIAKVLQGNLGNSLIDGTPVNQLIAERLPATLELIIGAFTVAMLIAFPAGIIAAARQNKLLDHVCTFIALTGMSIPHFWLGMMFIIFFSVKLGVLPASGYVPFSADPIANIKSMILPIVATGFRESAILMRMIRSSLLEVMQSDYIRTAAAKGLSEKQVIIGHALKNAMIPVVTTGGIMIAGLLGGLVITETIFNIPGYGKLIIDSVFSRDFITVQSTILVSAVLVIVINIIVDLLYTIIDPRIKLEKGGE